MQGVYQVGQVWAYKTREGEENSSILINKIEHHEKLGNIFHITINDLKLKNVAVEGGIQTDMPHVPVSQKTFDLSLTKLLGQADINAEYLQGYEEWHEVFVLGQAGIYTIDIADILGVIEYSLTQFEG